MRDLLTRSSRLALAGGAALLIAGCGGGDDAANVADANALDANTLLDEPTNDASAMESVANATEPAITDTGNQSSNSTDVLGNTSGGDTGGNTVESNISAI